MRSHKGVTALRRFGRRGGTVVCAFLSLAAVALSSGEGRAETLLERGTYLMQSIVACGNCHTPKGPDGELPGMELAGGFLMEDDAFTAFAPNITPDVETGIGGWTDEQIITAIREGRRPDGTIIGPPMPISLYRSISDRDVQAIVAYIRSLQPVKNEVPKSDYRMPLPPSYGPPVTTVAEVTPADGPAYGFYLAGSASNAIPRWGRRGRTGSTRRAPAAWRFPGPGASVTAPTSRRQTSATGVTPRSRR
jgi:mono/diheme cytochrome c family protein